MNEDKKKKLEKEGQDALEVEKEKAPREEAQKKESKGKSSLILQAIALFLNQ